MDKICHIDLCTGCTACVNSCPLNAIYMVQDNFGFLYPEINDNMCIDCGKCKVACPQNNDARYNGENKFYAGVSFDDEIKEKSSSGGIFSLLAEKIIKKGGVVFGAAFDKEFNVNHIGVDKIADLRLLRGSKYVQSNIGDCFEQVENFLEKGRYVLFSGTPCQIDGLYSYLKGSPEKLYTIDILCHGIPSPNVFKDYIDNETANDEKINSFKFRSKKTGWLNYSTDIVFNNGGKTIYHSSYMQGFLNNYYLRECCYSCRYATRKRVGDITLGDFWGYREKAPAYLENDDRGISLVIVNSKKGDKLFKSIRKKAAVVSKSYDDAAKDNPILYTPSKKPVDYEDFQRDYGLLTWSDLEKKYFNEIVQSPVPIDDKTDEYISVPFKKRYYKHLLYCKKQDLINKIKKGK